MTPVVAVMFPDAMSLVSEKLEVGVTSKSSVTLPVPVKFETVVTVKLEGAVTSNSVTLTSGPVKLEAEDTPISVVLKGVGLVVASAPVMFDAVPSMPVMLKRVEPSIPVKLKGIVVPSVPV